MAETLPFEVPERLHARLPPPSRDGLIYADVKFRGGWDGILVINSERQCIGVYCGRRILVWPLPFTPADIEDLRRPCLWNRFLSNIPASVDAYGLSLFAIWIVCPILLVLSLAITPWLLPLIIALAVLSICIMYSSAGFPLTRLPTALAGFGFAMWAAIRLIQSFV